MSWGAKCKALSQGPQQPDPSTELGHDDAQDERFRVGKIVTFIGLFMLVKMYHILYLI